MSFSVLLKHEDRERLRKITRNVHLKFYPTDYLTDLECDKFIDAMGPEVVEQQLKFYRDRGLVE